MPDELPRNVTPVADGVFASEDGAAAAQVAAARARSGERTAVWVGDPADPRVAEFLSDLDRAGREGGR